PTRSHFDAFAKMEFAETGLPSGTVTNGWITRFLASRSALGVLRGVALEDIVPLSLSGADSTLPIADPENFLFPGDPISAQERSDLLAEMYALTPPPVGSAALDTFASIDLLGNVDFTGYVPANGVQYPATPLGNKLRNAAVVIKAQIGVEVITIDMAGWDLHANLGPLTGSMAAQLNELTGAIEAFYLDMLGQIDDVTLVVQSEFGRRVQQNSSTGLDHGHGNAMLVLGGSVAGGQVLGSWPGLAPSQLDDGDLAITTDYRDVLGEILAGHFGVGASDLAVIFPQHTFSPVGVTV
ncbi:MAG TPA: DUF1501 domain-containing protein, partial [Planctomycetes bacterium]|nr:DUF1501 domain-containing protein [Planctomycetota bacterium]